MIGLLSVLSLMTVSVSAGQLEEDQLMSPDRFWKIVAETKEFEIDPAAQLEALAAALGRLSPAEIEAFEREFHEL